MLKLFSYLRTVSLYPAARMILTAQSELQRLRTFGKKPKLHFEAAYDGRRIMLLALYQKGELRPDLIRLLQAARAEGLYILAVNTLKLTDPQSLRGLLDCYIERPNFGRDFGSYQTGFLHLFQRGCQTTCPRLLMVNDSIFFSQSRLPKFLNDMMTSEVEVLGATENYEIEYHLGSFCIAMGQSVLQKPRFQSYWRKYRLTDVRPRVIARGEMRLSKTLKRCASNQDNFSALYSSARYYRESQIDNDLLKFSIQNARTASLTPARRLDSKTILAKFESGVVHKIFADRDKTVRVETNLRELNATAFATNVEDIYKIVQHSLADFSKMNDDIFYQYIHAAATELFMRHSQIHQNSAILIRMGLPIIKLDLIYRGMANVSDMTNIVHLLDTQEGQELCTLLMSRPFGEDVLFGWKRSAFMIGLI